MVQAVHTAVPGRARYKVEGLYRSDEVKRYLETELSRESSVRLVSANALTGNVLVFYDSKRTADEIGEALGKLMPETGGPEGVEGSLPAPVSILDAHRKKPPRKEPKASPRVLRKRLGEAGRGAAAHPVAHARGGSSSFSVSQRYP